MYNDRDWAELPPHHPSTLGEAGLGLLRITLLFGSFAIAIALFLAPILDRTDEFAAATGFGGIDRTTTGSIAPGNQQYTIHRSVLQTSPSSLCIIHANGVRTGDC